MVEIDSPEQFAVALSVMIMHYALLMMMIFAEICTNTLANGNVLGVPQNTTVMINHTAYFTCTVPPYSQDVHWFHNNDAKFIYAGREILGPFKERFSVNISSGVSKLTISSVKPEDAGRYICEDGGFGKDQFSAFLTVLEGHPRCNSSKRTDGFIGQNGCGISPDVVELSCFIKFHGEMHPEMTWITVGENHHTDGNITTIISGNRITYTLRLNANSVLNNATYSCQTTQLSGHQLHCHSGVINVINMKGSNRTLNKNVGDEVTCSDHSNKNCTYSWQSLQGDSNIFVPASFGGKLNSFKIENSGIYQCEKVCIFRGVPCTVQILVVNVPETKDDGRLTRVYVVLLLIPIAVVYAIIILVCLVKRRIRGYTAEAGQLKTSSRFPPFKTPTLEEDGRDPHHTANVSIRHPSEPIKTITTLNVEYNNTPIYGMAILGDELFIATGWSSTIEVWNLVELARSRQFEILQLMRPFDLVSCTGNRCLYIFDFKGEDVKWKQIIRVAECGVIISQWGIGKDVCQNLSVTYDRNVIFATFEADVPRICEYNPDGVLLRSIKISPDTKLNRIFHVIKVEDDQFLISHGSIKYKNFLHRVCIAESKKNNDGEDVLFCVKQSFGGQRGSNETQLNVPMHLAIRRDGTVLVADRENSRVLLLSWPSLKLIREQITKMSETLRTAYKLCLDESRGCIFVVDNARVPTKETWGDGRILAFEIK